MKGLKDFNFKNKKVLVRCDFNIPLDKEGNILDDFRIRKTIPTIEYLVKKGAKIILMSHLGRPKGKVIEKLRLTPVQQKLMEYLDLSITKAKDCIGKEIEEWVNQMQPGEILLLENLRFHKEEKANDESFAESLARLGDIYINDAFGTCHRSHASIVGIPKYLPSGVGFLLEKEIKILKKLIEKPKKPLIGIIGGKKVETKARPIDKISKVADFILIGDLIKKEIEEKNISFRHPEKIIKPIGPVEENKTPRDLNSETINLFKEKIAKAKTIFWSGPLGQIEKKQFSRGTKEIAKAIIDSEAFSVIGGRETVGFINKIGLREKFNHLSTGGGAMLAYLAEEKLPGIEALKNES